MTLMVVLIFGRPSFSGLEVQKTISMTLMLYFFHIVRTLIITVFLSPGLHSSHQAQEVVQEQVQQTPAHRGCHLNDVTPSARETQTITP